MSGSAAEAERTQLGRQALKRELSQAELELARALERIFRSGVTDLAEAARQLQQDGIAPPSGVAAAWSVDTLRNELATINQSLDAAYARGGRP